MDRMDDRSHSWVKLITLFDEKFLLEAMVKEALPHWKW